MKISVEKYLDEFSNEKDDNFILNLLFNHDML